MLFSTSRGRVLPSTSKGLATPFSAWISAGQGQNPRGQRHDTQQLVEDLQAGYFFLVDRHNRGDLNLAKLGVIALGDGANLVAAWAFQPGAAVTTEGRPSDLSALVLISPKPEGFGYVLGHVLASLAPRVPLLLLAGDRDIRRRMPCNRSSRCAANAAQQGRALPLLIAWL